MRTENGTSTDGPHLRIRSFILEKFPAARTKRLDDELPLLEAGIVDSLGVLDVVGFLEHAFHIKVDDEDLTPDNFATVRCMVSFVERNRRGGTVRNVGARAASVNEILPTTEALRPSLIWRFVGPENGRVWRD